MISIWKQDNGLVQVDRFERNTWINVINPSQEEIEKLTNYYRVPSEFITDILDVDERSRSEVEGRWLMIILRIPVHSQTNNLPFYTVPLGVLISHNLIVTICNSDNEVTREISSNPKYRNIKLTDKANFVLQLFLCSATSFLRYLKDINRMTNQVEQDLLISARNKELYNLLKMEKCMVYFVTSLKSNELLLYKLQRSKLVNLEEIDQDLLEDVITENKQAIEMANIYSDIQSGMMDAFASVVSNNVNVVMKQLTSVTIILMIPTLIASIYGMNVPNFLENNHYAFLIILAMSVAFSTLGVLFFRKRNFF